MPDPVFNVLTDIISIKTEFVVRFREPANNSILNRESAKNVMKGTQLSMDPAPKLTPPPKLTLDALFGPAEYALLALRDGTSTLTTCAPLSVISAQLGMIRAVSALPATTDLLSKLEHVL